MAVLKRRTHVNRLISPNDEQEMLQLWYDGWRQDDIANRYGISQARVSQIITKLREEFPDTTIDEIVMVFKEQLLTGIQAVMPGVRAGNPVAIRSLVKLQERACHMLGIDKQAILQITNQVAQAVVYQVLDEDVEAMK